MKRVKDFLHRLLNGTKVKEGFDNLPDGLCYFTDRGEVQLCNRCMYELFQQLWGKDVQTLDELHIALERSEKRLSESSTVYVLDHDRAWDYTERKIIAQNGRTYTETLFFDVTDIYQRRNEILRQTRELEMVSRNIRYLTANVQEEAREKELLAMKTRLHDQMGKGLTAMRQIILRGEKTPELDKAILDLKTAVQFLNEGREYSENSDTAEHFIEDAATLGVTVVLTGELPKDTQALDVFLVAMRECLTNCVRHAEGTKLFISAGEEENGYTLCISNNGKPPEEEIVPSGGLKNLSHYVENAGGTMEIGWEQAFELRIYIPKGEGLI